MRAVGALSQPVEQLPRRLNAPVDFDLRRALDVDSSIAALDFETRAALHVLPAHAPHMLAHRTRLVPAAVLAAALSVFAVTIRMLAAAGFRAAIVQLGAIIAPIVIAPLRAPVRPVVASIPI